MSELVTFESEGRPLPVNYILLQLGPSSQLTVNWAYSEEGPKVAKFLDR